LKTAYKICRATLVTSKRCGECKEIDIEKIKRELESLVDLTRKISDFVTKATTISNNSEFIIREATFLKLELENRLNQVIAPLQK
jgi:hypothetical protein